jgi:hypothetical protein
VSFRTILILINLVAIAALLVFIVFRVVSLRRNPKHRDPENLTPFFDDDVLEGAHLERALGVSLIALVIVLIGMIAYFMAEPFRAEAQDDFFAERSIERGAVLFANEQSEDYNANFSLLCADCHGVDGGGGTASFVVASVDPRCEADQTVDETLAETKPYCLPQQVSWAAPNLQLASLRYTRGQIAEIITYGRPGTPMQAWGVASGKGSLNEQVRQGQGAGRQRAHRTPGAARRSRGGGGGRRLGGDSHGRAFRGRGGAGRGRGRGADPGA